MLFTPSDFLLHHVPCFMGEVPLFTRANMGIGAGLLHDPNFAFAARVFLFLDHMPGFVGEVLLLARTKMLVRSFFLLDYMPGFVGKMAVLALDDMPGFMGKMLLFVGEMLITHSFDN
jgi:hypothetical protein